jgi:hypothetical protein
MAKHLLLVHTNAVAGREEEYHRWYEETHIPDMLAVPHFVRAQRYEAVPSVRGNVAPQRFLVVYEIEADTAEQAMEELRGAMPGMELSAALDRAGAVLHAYSPIRAATAPSA